MEELKDIVLKKGDRVYFDNDYDVVGGVYDGNNVKETYCASFSKIVKIERPIKYKTIYKAPKQILDKEEKEYLEAVIRPYRDRVKYIKKDCELDFYYPTDEYLNEIIFIFLSKEYFYLPKFTKGTMYKGMEPNKEYTLKELGLFEGE